MFQLLRFFFLNIFRNFGSFDVCMEPSSCLNELLEWKWVELRPGIDELYLYCASHTLVLKRNNIIFNDFIVWRVILAFLCGDHLQPGFNYSRSVLLHSHKSPPVGLLRFISIHFRSFPFILIFLFRSLGLTQKSGIS